MLETSTNGARAADEEAAGREDQRGVAGLGFGAGGGAAPAGVPDPELVEQAKRRSFTAKYKLEILAKADACTRPGEVGELLRREGLYTSHLTYWRKQRKGGALKELGKPRGRKPAEARRADRGADAAGRAGGVGAGEDEASRGDSGKSLSAVGADARYREREREHRAMIERTVEELTPIIGTRPACRAVGASPATIYRRRRPPEPRTPRPRPTPERALSEPEREAVLEVLHSERFVDISPEETYATLLDEGTYLCSTRTMYRILAAHHGGVRERRNQLTHPAYAKPELLAERPNELWSWDVSKLKGPAKWTYYYLYVILDVFSRYVVGWAVQYRENAQLAKALIEQATEQQKIMPKILTLHADRGAPQRAKPVAFLLADLGITKTHSRPYTSSDNPYSESNFKTLKYRPEFPERFDDIEDARAHCRQFFRWYNHEHRHSGIGLMTPAAFHHGQAQQLYDQRAVVLAEAYARNPKRFVGKPPAPPELPTAAWINKPKEVAAAH